MKQYAQQIRTKLLTVITAGAAGVGVGFATAATSASVGANANVDAGAQVAAPSNAQASSYVDVHLSTTGSTFRTAQWQSGATGGADRAAERMGTSIDGLEQSTAAGLESAGMATAKAKHPGTR